MMKIILVCLSLFVASVLVSCDDESKDENTIQDGKESDKDAPNLVFPSDSMLLQGLCDIMAPDDNDQESIRIRAVLKITNKRAFKNGFIVETDASMGNPCETVQIHTFSKTGKHLQMEEFVLGCDCPSECEGCFDWKSIHWIDDTRFYLERELTLVLNDGEDGPEMEYDMCDTEVRYSRTPYEIRSDGTIQKGMESVINPKEAVLGNAKGDHLLSSISALYGANTLYDYTKSDGNWYAEGSSTSQGRRTPFDIDLGPLELSVLNSLTIQVREDLSVDVICNNRVLFSVPFEDAGNNFKLSKSNEDYIMGVPEGLSAENPIIDHKLYLTIKDEVPSSEINEIDIVIETADAYSLAYNTQNDEFELTLFYADCCDNATYSFEKQ
jgi:hypothetical protein